MNAGRTIILIGIAIVVVGAVVMLSDKLGLPRLGRLPGDFVWKGRFGTVYVPITTCIVLSILLTIVLSFLGRR